MFIITLNSKTNLNRILRYSTISFPSILSFPGIFLQQKKFFFKCTSLQRRKRIGFPLMLQECGKIYIPPSSGTEQERVRRKAKKMERYLCSLEEQAILTWAEPWCHMSGWQQTQGLDRICTDRGMTTWLQTGRWADVSVKCNLPCAYDRTRKKNLPLAKFSQWSWIMAIYTPVT